MSQIVERWIADYLTAWKSNEPDDIRALFADDARYFTEPYADPWVGLDDIVENWVDAADMPESFTFEWAEVAFDSSDSADDGAGVGVVQATTDYVDGVTYSNLWIIRFHADGRAIEFTEWYMSPHD